MASYPSERYQVENGTFSDPGYQHFARLYPIIPAYPNTYLGNNVPVAPVPESRNPNQTTLQHGYPTGYIPVHGPMVSASLHMNQPQQHPLIPTLPIFNINHLSQQYLLNLQHMQQMTAFSALMAQNLQPQSTQEYQSTTSAVYPDRSNGSTSSTQFLERPATQVLDHENSSSTDSHRDCTPPTTCSHSIYYPTFHGVADEWIPHSQPLVPIPECQPSTSQAYLNGLRYSNEMSQERPSENHNTLPSTSWYRPPIEQPYGTIFPSPVSDMQEVRQSQPSAVPTWESQPSTSRPYKNHLKISDRRFSTLQNLRPSVPNFQNPSLNSSNQSSEQTEQTQQLDLNPSELTYKNLKIPQEEKNQLEEIRIELNKDDDYKRFLHDEMEKIHVTQPPPTKRARLEETAEFVPKNKEKINDEKYLKQRQKNNIAAQLSREKAKRLAEVTSISIKYVKRKIEEQIRRQLRLKKQQVSNSNISIKKPTENENTTKKF